MLKPLNELLSECANYQYESGKVPHVIPVPSRTCEACGKVVDMSHDAINVMVRISFQVGSPGHIDLPAFKCPAEEHWACSIDCLSQVGKACLDEHVIEILKLMHQSVLQGA